MEPPDPTFPLITSNPAKRQATAPPVSLQPRDQDGQNSTEITTDHIVKTLQQQIHTKTYAFVLQGQQKAFNQGMENTFIDIMQEQDRKFAAFQENMTTQLSNKASRNNNNTSPGYSTNSVVSTETQNPKNEQSQPKINSDQEESNTESNKTNETNATTNNTPTAYTIDNFPDGQNTTETKWPPTATFDFQHNPQTINKCVAGQNSTTETKWPQTATSDFNHNINKFVDQQNMTRPPTATSDFDHNINKFIDQQNRTETKWPPTATSDFDHNIDEDKSVDHQQNMTETKWPPTTFDYTLQTLGDNLQTIDYNLQTSTMTHGHIEEKHFDKQKEQWAKEQGADDPPDRGPSMA